MIDWMEGFRCCEKAQDKKNSMRTIFIQKQKIDCSCVVRMENRYKMKRNTGMVFEEVLLFILLMQCKLTKEPSVAINTLMRYVIKWRIMHEQRQALFS